MDLTRDKYEYVGAVHMHSNFSDGSGDAGEIAEIANEVGLDFIILTDHNTLRALHEGFEGFYGKTFMMVGCEINDKENKNHYIALGIEETISTRLPAKDYVKEVKEAGGIGFLAHPHEKRNSMKEHPPYPWTEWDTDDFTGIEIWNHMSEWMENLTEQNKYQSFLHPLKTIVSPPIETLEVWDKLSLKRKVVGIGGIDAHAHKVNVLGFVEVEVFPYKVLFKSIRTHILTDKNFVIDSGKDNIAATKEIILSALKYGNCFISNSYHGDANGFRFNIEKDDKIYGMGDTVPFDTALKLKVLLPGNRGTVKVIKNGVCVSVLRDNQNKFDVDTPGVYRVEVYLGEKAWIFSNHIRIE